MFNARYFAPRYFAPRYWPEVGSDTLPPIPPPPAAAPGYRLPLRPNFTQRATGKCRYRPWVSTIASDYLFAANGWDQPFYFNGTAYADMGSVEPTTGSPGLVGATGWLANGSTASYYIVWRNSTLGKETAPHAISVSNATGGTRDVQVTWTDPVIAEFDKARLYRQLAATGTYVKVADIAIATATYTDSATDASIALNFVYVRRWRTTKPPIFAGLVAHGNRLWGWTGKDALLNYGQLWRTDGEFVLDDFPSAGATSDGGVLVVAPNDGFGPITGAATFFEALYVFKRYACYRVTGKTAATFAVELVFSARGCVAHRTIRVIEDTLFFLENRGVCAMTADGTVSLVAALEENRESPLAPVWARVNLDAAHLFNAEVDEAGGYYLLALALDDDPVPLHLVPFDFRRNRYVSRDTFIASGAMGRLLDASGVLHVVRLDELGNVLEDGIGDADVVVSGTTQATVTSSTALGVLTASAAVFDTTSGGLVGGSVERWSLARVVLDQNRIAANTATTLTLLYYSSAAVTNASDLVSIGPVPAVFRSGKLDFGRPRWKKRIATMVLRYVLASSSTLKVEGAVDSASDVSLVTPGIVLDDAREKQLVPVRQYGFAWAFQLSNRSPNEPWSVASVDLEMSEGDDRE